MTNESSPERRAAVRQLVAAAQKLLAAREEQQLQSPEEWRNLQAACDAYWATLADACPTCGEADHDRLVWIDDQQVQCQGCTTLYAPGGPRQS